MTEYKTHSFQILCTCSALKNRVCCVLELHSYLANLAVDRYFSEG